ncbi:uncharacterized protein AKAW2_10338A [Aspergillus luchuensis]|uniref:Uncharacterized protein n=1 Tax=Aspergillus kawachii TaxID=1069201 RepID=A0A7R7VYW2_ASPKA|nr:uncharacterized protein AKAW2_10338A [Aspergillus luchuensis]BCR93292.1 hypothetical protein AKAW2_10338A [Aspergillus luchuensis]
MDTIYHTQHVKNTVVISSQIKAQCRKRDQPSHPSTCVQIHHSSLTNTATASRQQPSTELKHSNQRSITMIQSQNFQSARFKRVHTLPPLLEKQQQHLLCPGGYLQQPPPSTPLTLK